MQVDKIICGNCVDILKEYEDQCIDLVITSPPYSTYKKYSNLKDDLGNLDIIEQKPILMKIFKEIHRILKRGRKFVLFFSDVWHKENNEMHLISPTFYLVPDILDLGFKVKNIFIWRKGGSFSNMKRGRPLPASPVIQSYFEYIFVFQKDGKPDYSYIKAEDKKRSFIPMKYVTRQSGVFTFPNNMKLKRIHPAVFPVELIKILIMLYSFVNDIVLDPFGGIGTVAVAAKALERHFISIDINPDYCNIAEGRVKETVSEVDNIQERITKLRNRAGIMQVKLFSY